MAPTNPDTSDDDHWRWPTFIALTLAQLWAAHAVAFFAHEYAHTFTAWILGRKSNPFDLHVPALSPVVFLAQLGINQNVDEAPIFAGGHGVTAATIALAGSLLGNAMVTLPLSRLAYRRAAAAGRRGWGLLAYWVAVASVGNFVDYVPIRTFTLDGDMGSVRRGFGWSPWVVLLVLGVPTLLVVIDLLTRIVPATLAWAFPDARGQRYCVAVLTAFVLFGFYGAAGLVEGGATSHLLSVLSVGIVFPLAVVLEILLVRRRSALGAGRPVDEPA